MSSDTMKAVVWEGKPFQVAVKQVPKPKIEHPNDAVIRITSAGICGTDLHTYHGIFGSAKSPWLMGHEGLGIVVEAGAAVKSLKVGDRVIIPVGPDDGQADNDVTTDDVFGAAFGLGPDFGNLGGLQAEYVRMPFADQSCVPLPAGTDNELDFLFISDIWATAWACLDFSGFQPGDSVAVFGAGPVGLLCAYSAILRGASKVYVIDHVSQRLDKAASIGAIPINFLHFDPVDFLKRFEPQGVNRSCDCCGYECLDRKLQLDSSVILRNAVRVTAVKGGIGVAGVYVDQPKSAGRPNADPALGNPSFPFAEFWLKGLTMEGGPVNGARLFPILRELIISGRAKPGFIVSSEISIDDAPEGYRRFSDKKETKVVLKFPF
ncbi:MAG: mitochondrial ribosomal large subunit component [Watsoniomyces obsoletus]|nr:MAG: mitochondrial ribosomal large subunit component [Watsoniomyces obsoletus]